MLDRLAKGIYPDSELFIPVDEMPHIPIIPGGSGDIHRGKPGKKKRVLRDETWRRVWGSLHHHGTRNQRWGT